MTSAITLRYDAARTGTALNFPFDGNPWRKYASINLSASMRAGVLVVENWVFETGPHVGKTYTLVLASASDNTVSCFSEGQLLAHGSAATPLWTRSLGVNPRMDGWGTPGAGGHYSNIPEPIGVLGTPVVDIPNRRMFVMSCWTANPNPSAHDGHYTIFSLALDDGSILNDAELVDPGASGRPTFEAQWVDQRSALNHVDGWLWAGFADFQNDDVGPYYGWVVAIKDDFTQQLYQPMSSLPSTDAWNVYGSGVWGPGGAAAASDGSVYALTGNATQTTGDDRLLTPNYWQPDPNPVIPGERNDFFNALVRLGVDASGATPEVRVLDWFQGSNITQNESGDDLDFGGSSPVVLPPIDGRNLVAFVPKDGKVFVLDADHLGNWSVAPTAVAFGDPNNDTKVALAYVQTPDPLHILVVGANTSGSAGGLAAYTIDGSSSPPTLNQRWKAAAPLHDSFGSPTVIANPVLDPANPPDPFALAWVVDGSSDDGDRYLSGVTVRAYDVKGGHVLYDSTTNNDVTERIPHFAPITAGANSVFIATDNGFIGFTQVPRPAPALTFIVDRSTFGRDEIRALEGSAGTASVPAYWVELSGVLPDDIGVTASHLAPSMDPGIALNVSGLPPAEQLPVEQMIAPGVFAGQVIPENPGLPDQPQAFLFPYSIGFAGLGGFAATPAVVGLSASLDLGGTPLGSTTQIELVASANPYFLDVDPAHPKQPTWLSFDLRLFSVAEGNTRFAAPALTSRSQVNSFITTVIANLNSGQTGGDTFEGIHPGEQNEALEWTQTNDAMQNVYNFALARVRLTGETIGATPFPARVFFRLFQAQNTVSNFNSGTTYRETTRGDPIALLGVQSGEYVTIPCFAAPRINLHGPASMTDQADPPNAQFIAIATPGETVEAYFGCWIDNNQPDQRFLPATPPPPGSLSGGADGPWMELWTMDPGALRSVLTAITSAPHQCVIAEINYPSAPPIPGATTGTSDKLAQRNIAWINGPNPGQGDSRRMPHPVQVWPTPRPAEHPDELMIFWGAVPPNSEAQLFLPAVDAAAITDLANRLRSWQYTWMVDAHTIGVICTGVTFLPLPVGIAPLAGLLTITVPEGVRRGESYRITVRQLTDKLVATPTPPPNQLAAERAAGTKTTRSQGVSGAFEFGIQISTKDQLRLGEERRLALMRYLEREVLPQARWHPVLLRYLEYTAGRVLGFGGDPTSIRPSPIGWVPGLPMPPSSPGGAHREGKIEGLRFDHFGDFIGFVLVADDGNRDEFESREPGIEKLAGLAQREHRRVHVVPESHHRHRVHRVTLL